MNISSVWIKSGHLFEVRTVLPSAENRGVLSAAEFPVPRIVLVSASRPRKGGERTLFYYDILTFTK